MSLNGYDFARARLLEMQPKGRFAAQTPEDAAIWTERQRGVLRRMVGTLDEPFPALEPAWSAPDDLCDLQRTKVEFSTRRGLRALGYLLAPRGVSTGPGMVCVPGHGVGVDAIVGLAEPDYQHQFALQAARKGYTVLAIEPVGFGHRRSNDQGNSCLRDSAMALSMGETMIGWRVRDAMAAVSLLASIPAVDPDRVGIAGISGGGTVALWTAALDTRIRAALVSGYLCTFAECIWAMDHCIDNYAPSVGLEFEMSDIASLVAPRGLFAESGTLDPIFPKSGFLTACEAVKLAYQAHQAPDMFRSCLFDGEHEFHGAEGFAALDEWFSTAAR